MTVVIDASVAFAGLTSPDPAGVWAREILSADDVVGPELLTVEVSHLLRKAALRGALQPQVAREIVADLRFLVNTLLPHRPLLARIWELHSNLTAYDATYVALAEALDAPLATLDQRLVRAPGPRCNFRTPGAPPHT